MKGICAWSNRIYRSELGRFALGAIIALLLYATALVLQPVITFYDNDDLNIAWALAGYRSVEPAGAHPFLNPVTAALVSALYGAVPTIPWWYAVQTICLLCGIAVVCACICKAAYRSGLPLIVPFLVLVLVCGGLYYYAITQVMFTLTSTVLGMAAAALLLVIDAHDSVKLQRLYRIASIGMLALSFLIRQSSGLCAACFFFGALAYRMMTAVLTRRALRQPALDTTDAQSATMVEGQESVRPLHPEIATVCCALAVVVGLTLLNNWGRAHQHEPGFLAFEEARAEFMDYPHDEYEQNPALYASAGWDKTLYDLVGAWFYMDARVNAETLQKVSEQSVSANLSGKEQLSRAAAFARTFLEKYPIARYLGVIAAGALVVLLLGYALGGGNRSAFVFGVLMAFGACILLAALFWRNRMNLRTWMTVLFPAIIALLLLAADAYRGGRSGKRVLLAVLCAAFAVPMLFCGYKIFRTAVSYDSRAALSDANAIVDYAMAHPDNVYLRDVYAGNNYDALRTFPDDKPVNLIDWGGCDTLTRARRMQWQLNGFDTDPNACVLLQTGVYYVCNVDAPYLDLLTEYMCTTCGASGCEIVDTLQNGLAVVRFLP